MRHLSEITEFPLSRFLCFSLQYARVLFVEGRKERKDLKVRRGCWLLAVFAPRGPARATDSRKGEEDLTK